MLTQYHFYILWRENILKKYKTFVWSFQIYTQTNCTVVPLWNEMLPIFNIAA